MGGRHYAVLLFFVGLLQIAAYWFSGSMVETDCGLAISQPDTPLYLQAARRVAEGHPFSYSEGTAPSTGTTSVMHPFLLAIPYLIGFKGTSFVAAGFWLNAFFYLIFLAGWGWYIWKTVQDVRTRFLSGLLLSLFSQTAYCAFAQSDIGFWLAFSGVLAAAFVSANPIAYGTLLALGPWARPEGMVLVIAFVMVLIVRALLAKQRPESANVAVALLGVISILGVFALNYSIWGHAQFSSVIYKGHFKNLGLFEAIYASAFDLMQMVRAFVLGMPSISPRHFYAIPFFGAVFLWLGVMRHDWKSSGVWLQLVMLLGVLGGLLTVSASGWQDTNLDRYIAWVMPLLVIFSAEGIMVAYRYAADKTKVAPLVWIVPVIFFAGGAVAFAAFFHSACVQSNAAFSFGYQMDASLPKDASVGTEGWCMMAYPLGNRRLAHVSGIYSPEFSAKTVNGNLEILKNEPNTRFDYWLVAADDSYGKRFLAAQGEVVLTGPDGMQVKKANWSHFDRAGAIAMKGIDDLVLKCRVDVGYEKEEREAQYEQQMRHNVKRFESFTRVDELNGEDAFEVGRVIYGYDEMTVDAEIGKELVIVMRTLPSAEVECRSPITYRGTTRKFEFKSSLQLGLSVDGECIGVQSVVVADKGFSDVIFTIPGDKIKTTRPRIAFLGDHIACCYWFFVRK